MQQGSDYNPSYYQYHHPPHLQNPNNDLQHQPNPSPTTSTYASAPPFTSPPQDYPNFPSNYPSYSQNPDHIPTLSPTAPSHTNPQNPNNNYQNFIPSPRTSHHPSPFSSFNPTPEPEPAPAPAPYSAQQPPPYYSPYEQTYAPAPPQPISIPTNNPTTNPNLPFSNSYPNSYGGPSVYEPPYESRGGNNNYLDESLARYGGVQPQESVYNRSRSDAGYLYDRSSIQDDLYGGGGGGGGQNAYAYDGGKVEPYGARGTSGKSGSSFSAAFDDYGRSLTGPAKENVSLNKVLKAVPKVETQQDVKNGVQKFRVKLLAESGGQSPMDVLCQIGLDGIRMLDPSSGRTLRIYPLETITRSEVLDSSIFAFWSKSTVDIEPRRIRLKSSSYTTNTILDTVTAATIQLKEIGGDSLRSRQSDSGKQSEQLAEKKKGFDWVNLIKPGNEEKDHWVPDEAVTKCTSCGTDFGAFVRKHHCRNCGDIFCDKCTHGRIALTAEENAQQVRVCDRCLAEVTQRLSNVKESASKPALCSHEDLAKKLQDEMEKNRKASSGSKSSDGSGRRMKEVACPTCTVHLQVQVPSSGSETIECGVCQHPFLVSAH